jgi:hypothetical protein
MKKLIIIVLVALMSASLLAEGSAISGKWATWKKGDPPVVLQFQSSGTALTGTVRIAGLSALEILDGKVVGNRLTFKAMVPSGDDRYPMMFSGRRSGGKIDFKCDVEVNVPGENVEFGPACLAHLTVRRSDR